MNVLFMLPNAILPVMSICCSDDFQVIMAFHYNRLSLERTFTVF
jgi:hypothetical protein